MKNTDLQTVVLGDASRITSAIGAGAGWEIWMQIELYLLLKQNGLQAAREVPFPPPNDKQRLDILCRDDAGDYAIELKVESATNAGTSVLKGVEADVVKLASYPKPATRWAVGLAYSAVARNALQIYASHPARNAVYAALDGLGVLVVTVP